MEAAHPPCPAIERLPSKHRARLRKEAHDLKPVHHVGKDGVTPPVAEAVRDAFNTRELLKVKVLDGAPGSPREMAEELAEAVEGVHVVQVMGSVATLWRRQERDD